MSKSTPRGTEPRWPALLVVLSAGTLHFLLPSALAPAAGPPWLLTAVVAILMVPTLITFRTGQYAINHVFGFLMLAVVTSAEVWSLALLLQSLPQHVLPPSILLRSAAALWIVNILVFTLWYWQLDAGGPHARDERRRVSSPYNGGFLFPQVARGDQTWWPEFLDYLFLAFNHNTALSATDTAILAHWAKALVMLQAGISLITLAVLAARAINIL